ncbi:hypothetical protein ACIPW9_35980 [Streptomyces sp. NPDC090052]|uniref:hypothetical protein n=1 Tax=Streptomyces sp. NPDC090052 TaxID=3365931 RepID=UPI0037F54B6C
MTDIQLTSDREQEIRALDLPELMSDCSASAISGHLATLLGEIDRLRTLATEPESSSPWERAMAGLNALVDAGVAFHVEPDGHISNPFGDEHIEWDLKAKRWVLTVDDAYSECPSCGAPADETGYRIPEHRTGCPLSETTPF